MGSVDEFLIFPCALPRLEVLVLMHHCKVYFSEFIVFPVSTRRRFDVVTALMTSKQRCMNVKTTLNEKMGFEKGP